MNLVLCLIGFPLVAAFALACIRKESVRGALVNISAALVAAGSLMLLLRHFHQDTAVYRLIAEWPHKLMFAGEVALGLFILYQGIRFKKPFVIVLVVLQSLLMLGFELFLGRQAAESGVSFFVDKLCVIMALIIGVIGGLICVYAVGYMRDFHEIHHRELWDKRGVFFALLFVFLSAMFGVVFSNTLTWMYFFWEITTLCSFLLIGYKETTESRDNAFFALAVNLAGGLAFALAIVYLYITTGVVELDKLLSLGKGAALVPAVLLAFAGMTKSAQLPFSSWLTRAMVAPTPVSALLHSSTMVKAGVYLLVKLAFVLHGTAAGFMVALVGGTTFLITSFIAISQSDAKKVLAYSTIANLGLIVMCSGIGTYEAVWAAILLIVFHAIAKCLLFLCVGVVEHRINSRNIEDMDGLVVMMPKLTNMMLVGMAGMFLAPFGMLISKWAVLKALVDANPMVAALVVFGSAATLFFWVKWMGKLITVIDSWEKLEHEVSGHEWTALWSLTALTIGVCGFFPYLSSKLIEPYVIEVYGRTMTLSQGNIIIMSSMLALIMLFPLNYLRHSKHIRFVNPYLGGANAHTNTEFYGSMGLIRGLSMRNYYLNEFFGEGTLLKVGIGCSVVFLIGMFIAVVRL